MVTLLKEQNDKITAKSFDELISKLEKHGYDCKNCYEGDDYLLLKKDGDTYQTEYYKKANGSYELYLGNIHPSKRTKNEGYIKEDMGSGISVAEICRLSSSLDDFIMVCVGSLRRKDVIYYDTIRRVPEELKDAYIRSWGINAQGELKVQVDEEYRNVIPEEYK